MNRSDALVLTWTVQKEGKVLRKQYAVSRTAFLLSREPSSLYRDTMMAEAMKFWETVMLMGWLEKEGGTFDE